MTEPIKVKLQAYEGPLDLLLDLIQRNEMDIYNIQIAEITQQYLDYLREMRELDLEVAGDFLVMAATLMYIKSRMLLPDPGEDAEDEGLDPREELVRKLLEYKAFKEVARELGMLETERGKMFTRQIADHYLRELDPDDATIDSFSANLFDLLQAFHNVLATVSKDSFHEVFEEIVSIEEKIDEIKRRLTAQREIAFRELFHGRFSKNELIATFLALLEIVRSKCARVNQPDQFGEILIQRIEGSAA